MKLLFVLAAPVAVALTAMPAQAQDRQIHSTTVTRHVEQDSRHDDHVAPNHGWHWKKVCTTSWSHHRKVRSCKNVRVHW